MPLNVLTALSPLDGRYAAKVEALRAHFSEFGLFRNRIRVEIEWLKALAAASDISEVAAFSPATVAELDDAIASFSVADAEAVKAKIAMLGLSARVESAQIGDKTVYRVRMGPYGSASELADAKAKLGSGGLSAIAVKTH